MDYDNNSGVIDLGEVMMSREVKEKQAKRFSGHFCVFCKEEGNMLSFRGRYFCIKCYNQLMEKLD
jgi:nitrate reductase cytochrome c-type subunit